MAGRRQTLRAIGALGALGLSPTLWAQARALSIVVTQVPGGASDFMARALSEHLGQTLNVPAIVLNKPGAAGEIAATLVSGSAPDGMTLLVGSSSAMAVSPQVRRTRYDPIKDFRALGGVVIADTIVVANPSRGFTSLKDVIGFARANPGKLSFASNGVGGAFHLAMEYFQSLAGIKLLHVPFNGSSQGELALLSNQVDLMVTNTASALPHVKKGSLSALAVVGSRPSQELPDVAMASASVPGFVANTWLAIYAPAALPDATANELNAAIERYLKSPKGEAFLRSRGFIHVESSLADARAWTLKEMQTWGAIVAAARKNGPIE